MKHVYTRFAVFLLLILPYVTGFAQVKRPIGIFDLRYTLTSDVKVPQNLNTAWEDVHLIATLQGIVNRKSPELYIKFVENGPVNIDQYWWNLYRQKGKWLYGRDTMVYTNILALVNAYKNEISGVVVYDPKVASTSNVASSISGIENLIAIRYDKDPSSLYSRLVVGGTKLPVKSWLVNPDGSSRFKGTGSIPGTERLSTGSPKNDAYLWFLEKYIKTGKCNTKYGAYYIDQEWLKMSKLAGRNHHTLSNHDFFVSKKGFFFDLSPWGDEAATDELSQKVGTDLSTLKELLLAAYKQNKGDAFTYLGGFPPWAFKYTKHAGGSHDDVPTEWEYSRIISAYNAFKDADAIGYGALANASFWQHFPLKEKYKQKWVTPGDLQKTGYLRADGSVNFNGRDFIIFYVGDYDASSWLSQMTPFMWDNKERGKLPLMWSISPVLEERIPMAMAYLRESASAKDYFVAADNGAGYLMPGMLQSPRPISGLPDGLDAWVKHNIPYYKRWDITISGFIIDGLAPALNSKGLDAYAKFSPNGIVPQKTPLTLLHGNMPVLRADADINQGSAVEAANAIIDRVDKRNLHFHWFRNILKDPGWYVRVVEELKKKNPKIELLDAPTFFQLYRIWLKQNPAAAAGKIN
ncbi:GxGYxYP domain-containing protein [Pedobacter sp. JCM 36344]|uniref:GxGYxYP domain-containing protein n=1 Tax=Pedobacter sp. JCM 36344 TaxID=3374280 RepID=UPI00397DE547